MSLSCDVPIATAKIRLRPDLQVSLCRSAGKAYVLVEDGLASKFYRLGLREWETARRLDGRRTLRSVCEEVQQSPQEVAQLAQWLIQVGLADAGTASGLTPGGTPGNRTWVHLAGSNLLFIKVTLPNPERFLQRIYPWSAVLFSPGGTLLWLVACLWGIWTITGQWTRFSTSAQEVFAAHNWCYLVVVWILLKAAHELAHAVACMRYGGTVNRCGLMFILFSPIAWVDVTSAWNFRSKWARIAVSAAGMYVECFCAALAAIVWGVTTDPMLGALCRNVVLMAGVSTVLFNLNFLMRFDGYYILSDWLNLPNLYPTAQHYVRHLAKRLLLDLPSDPPTVEPRLIPFVVLYGLATLLWRLVFCVGILLAAVHLFHGVGLLLALLSGCVWFGLPILRLGQLFWRPRDGQRPNTRRLALIAAASLILAAALLALPWPGTQRVHGVVDFRELEVMRADSPGFIQNIHVAPGERVAPGQVLLEIENPALRRELADIQLRIQTQKLRQRVLQQSNETARSLAAGRKLESLREQRDQLERRVGRLRIHAPIEGSVIAPNLSSLRGTYVKRGQELLAVGAPGSVAVRIVVPQKDASEFRAHVGDQVTLGVAGRFKVIEPAHLASLRPRATRELPHDALAATLGGPLAVTRTAGHQGGRTELLEPCFPGLVTIGGPATANLRPGERCVVALRGAHASVGHRLWAGLREFVALRTRNPG